MMSLIPFKADIINSDNNADTVGENTKEKDNKTIQKEMNLKVVVETTLTKELNIEAQTVYTKQQKPKKRRSKEEKN